MQSYVSSVSLCNDFSQDSMGLVWFTFQELTKILFFPSVLGFL